MQEDICKLNEDVNELLKQNDIQILEFTDITIVKNIVFDKLGVENESQVGLEGASDKVYALYRVENLDRYDDRLQVTTNLIEAYDLLMEFVSKHTSDKFCLINNISTSIRGIISREVIGNILVHRDYSSAYPAKVIIEKDWLRTENWCIPRRHGNIMSDEFTPYPKNPLIQQFFANIGRTDTIGSGVRNLYKYTPMYSDGGKPELIEDDVFRINIPLDRIAADEATEQKTLSEREQKIYNMICENLHLSVEQVMAELDISRSTVFRDYAKIKKITGAMYDKKTSTWTLD